MEEEDKSKFGKFPEIGNTKWDYFRDNNQPVYATLNGQSYCGLVKEINREFVTLQPAIFPDASGTEYFIEDKPMFVPSQAIPLSIKENSLEEYVKGVNFRRLQERIIKRESIIIIPKRNP